MPKTEQSRHNLDIYTMNFKEQDFNSQELALFFQAFGKNLFIRPTEGEIYTASHSDDNGCTFYFKSDYYDQLKRSIVNAFEQGKFAQSNANREWIGLMNNFLKARQTTNVEIEECDDYYETAGQFWR